MDDSLHLYVRELGRHPLLDRDEEQSLFRRRDELRASGGSEDEILALEQRAVEANLRFVVSIAKGYEDGNVPLLDLVQEGSYGLIKAVGRFDYTRGYKLISYAVWWIRQAILEYFRKSSGVVRLPGSRVEELRQINKVIRRLTDERDGERPNVAEIADEMSLSEAYVEDALYVGQASIVFSLDASFNNDNAPRRYRTLGDILPSDEGGETPLSRVEDSELKRDVKSLLELLPEREEEIIRLCFGIDKDRVYTLEEIGQRFGLTRERVRQIKNFVVRRLKHQSRMGVLSKLIEHYED